MKPRGVVLCDLGEMKPAWLDWCKQHGLTSSQAFRQIALRMMERNKPAQHVPKPPVQKQPAIKRRVYVSLTLDEIEALTERARTQGFSLPAWIVNLVRSDLELPVYVGQHEQELLAESNMRILAIGRNLNQIARKLNTHPDEVDAYDAELVQELSVIVKGHGKKVAKVLQANVDRFARQASSTRSKE